MIVVACYIGVAYLTVSAILAASCLLATALPAWIAALAGIAWLPVMAIDWAARTWKRWRAKRRAR